MGTVFRNYQGDVTDGTKEGDALLEARLEPVSSPAEQAASSFKRPFLSMGHYGSERAAWMLQRILVGLALPPLAASIASIPLVGPIASISYLATSTVYVGLHIYPLFPTKSSSRQKQQRRHDPYSSHSDEGETTYQYSPYRNNAILGLILLSISTALYFSLFPESWVQITNPGSVNLTKAYDSSPQSSDNQL